MTIKSFEGLPMFKHAQPHDNQNGKARYIICHTFYIFVGRLPGMYLTNIRLFYFFERDSHIISLGIRVL